jgi:glycosyltransferase involved in cell wall biosynthesis
LLEFFANPHKRLLPFYFYLKYEVLGVLIPRDIGLRSFIVEIAAYTTYYGSPSSEVLEIYKTSVASFLSFNKSLPLHILVIDQEEPTWIQELQDCFPLGKLHIHLVRIPSWYQEGWELFRTYRFCARLLEELLVCIPQDYLISLDMDLIHVKPLHLKQINWKYLNMAEDSHSAYLVPFFYDSLEKWGGVKPIAYFNAGVMAFSKDTLKAFFPKVKAILDQIKGNKVKEPFFHDQDILNYLVNAKEIPFNKLPNFWNFSPCHELSLNDVKLSYHYYFRHTDTAVYHVHSGYPLETRLPVIRYLASVTGTLQKLIHRSPPTGQEPNMDSKVDPQDFGIVVISRNQEAALPRMYRELIKISPVSNILFVLDRCTDGSADTLKELGANYLEKTEGFDFDAGGSRNLGEKYFSDKDILFLDGDRVPVNLTPRLVLEALTLFDCSLLSTQINDDRGVWLTDKFEINPWFVPWPGNTKWEHPNNGVYTSGMLIKRSAINKVKSFQDGNVLFHKSFSGRYGYEDIYLGFLLCHLGCTCGAFPKWVYTEGGHCSTPDSLSLKVSFEKVKILLALTQLPTLDEPKESRPLGGFIKTLGNSLKSSEGNVLSNEVIFKIHKRVKYPIVVYYHIAQMGPHWRHIVEEQVKALSQSGLLDKVLEVRCVVLGTEELTLPSKFRIVYQGPNFEEYEIPCLNAMLEASKTEDFRVLYMHTKGASSVLPRTQELTTGVRKFMERALLYHFEECATLVTLWNAVGASLVLRHASNLEGNPWPPNPIFAGNFWWSTSDYIRGLSPLKASSSYAPQDLSTARHSAECWIGSKSSQNSLLELARTHVRGDEIPLDEFNYKLNWY